jgi:uncharacterized protein (TIGR00661 family)
MQQDLTSLKPNILIAPLDWGLGHAARCVPVVNALIRQNANVLIAAEGPVKRLLETEFPQLQFIELKGYRVSYSKNKWRMPFSIGRQIPKILSVIQYENQRLKEIVKEHRIDGIISDNRYGFYHQTVPSVFITHQLLIKTPLGRAAGRYLQRLNYRFINRFSECWVPDSEGPVNLAGDVAHPKKKPVAPIRYLGPISRFTASGRQEGTQLLIVLSGPEPQRTILENLLAKQLIDYKGPVVLVRGLPLESRPLPLPPHILAHDHLPARDLNRKMDEAFLVISRCGYSTIMDLAALKKKSILIPTPGQTEQEYLGAHAMKNNFALCIDQEKFRLKNAMELAASFRYSLDGYTGGSRLETVVRDFLEGIKSRS